MQRTAQINIVTLQEDDRYEFFGDATVSFDNTGATYVAFTTDETEMLIGISNNDTATVTRFGEDGYTLLVEKEQTHPFMLDGELIPVYTKKLRCKQTDKRIDLMVDYQILFGRRPVNNKLILKCVF